MKTLKEIAREAGVSMTTVSNVIHGNAGRVSAATIARINQIIEESGYVPNQAARSLAQRGSRLIAIIVQAAPGENILRNPYVAEYVGALTLELQRIGYYPLVRITDDYQDIEQNLLGWNVTGAIFSGAFSKKLQSVKQLSAIPTVLTDCYVDIHGANHVNVDDVHGGRLAAEYLLSMGHTRLALIAPSLEDSEVDQHRMDGFTAVLDEQGITLRPEHAFSLPSPEELSARLRALLSSPDAPTAIFCTADRIAAQLIAELAHMGVSVPGQVSVLGFDDLPLAQYTVPPLTTLRQDVTHKARLVTGILHRHIQNKSLTPERETIDVEVIQRASVRSN